MFLRTTTTLWSIRATHPSELCYRLRDAQVTPSKSERNYKTLMGILDLNFLPDLNLRGYLEPLQSSCYHRVNHFEEWSLY